MRINKTELLNDVRGGKLELLKEGYQEQPAYGMDNDVDDALADLEQQVAQQAVSRKDYNSDDEYQDAINDFFADGTEELCFVKRDSVLCSALMDFYAPNGTVKDFEKNAKKNIYGFESQMLGTNNSFDEEGFWFVAGNDYLDSLVPYKEQQAFMESVNPSPSLKRDVIHSLSNAESSNITQLLDGIQDNLEQREPHQDYKMTLDELESARNKLDL